MEIYINTKVQLAKMGDISLQLSDYEIENNWHSLICLATL